MIVKCTLKACGEDTNAACGSTNLCTGLEAGIEGDYHITKARAERGESMKSVDWKVDNGIWEVEEEEGEVQKSRP